jgi:hypothetical protein
MPRRPPVIDKQEFYHGAAIARALHDDRLESIRPHRGGYLANEDSFVLIKFSTRSTSPWRFTFTPAEISLVQAEAQERRTSIALVCGGDGTCGVSWDALNEVFDGNRPWISCSRRFNGRYAVAGAVGRLTRRVPHNHWPGVLFQPRGDERA